MADEDLSFDAEQFLFDKKVAIDHFFSQLYKELNEQPAWALQFFISFSQMLNKVGAPNDKLEEMSTVL
jgi:hypothetical protein